MGKASTSSRITAPIAARQYATSRDTASSSQVKSAAPHTGPVTVCTPPRRTITSASTERGTDSVSGEIEPLENAYRLPASPAKAPAMMNAVHCWARTSMPIRAGTQRRVATRAQRMAERRADQAPDRGDRQGA
jgi:hypothetical protein